MAYRDKVGDSLRSILYRQAYIDIDLLNVSAYVTICQIKSKLKIIFYFMYNHN
jgi:hypothetical protein